MVCKRDLVREKFGDSRDRWDGYDALDLVAMRRALWGCCMPERSRIRHDEFVPSTVGNAQTRKRSVATAMSLLLLFAAGLINFFDRSSLGVAATSIRAELQDFCGRATHGERLALASCFGRRRRQERVRCTVLAAF